MSSDSQRPKQCVHSRVEKRVEVRRSRQRLGLRSLTSGSGFHTQHRTESAQSLKHGNINRCGSSTCVGKSDEVGDGVFVAQLHLVDEKRASEDARYIQ
ncbi:hypothetical protein T265_04433 [Opisthorchis viverrini]|uniref:Uncharacterized protein n=1 Tax=Opisthorchis viverrini TaxID=6198 RepID=A0A074ZN52_OPIVI|nr:hypothetical protein T265_04433 [Opisthorchis viverrini]KER28828.1 hypothetical protein T265_04433 [Opisthorchis viverrini]